MQPNTPYRVAHKAGWLGEVQHDGTLVFRTRGTLLAAIMTYRAGGVSYSREPGLRGPGACGSRRSSDPIVRSARMIAEPDAVEIRVLGCLVEKQRTTPDVYPLSLNALRSACNQTTNREPIVSYDESMIRDALERLGTRGFARLASRGRALSTATCWTRR